MINYPKKLPDAVLNSYSCQLETNPRWLQQVVKLFQSSQALQPNELGLDCNGQTVQLGNEVEIL